MYILLLIIEYTKKLFINMTFNYVVYNLKIPEEIEDLFIITTASKILLATKYFSILIN